jgi:hypothetical protein
VVLPFFRLASVFNSHDLVGVGVERRRNRAVAECEYSCIDGKTVSHLSRTGCPPSLARLS